MSIRIAPLFMLVACTGAQTPLPAPAVPAPIGPPASPAVPSLVVLVVVDQLGTVHLERSGGDMTQGFARLLASDGWQGVGEHPHAKTETCPGHVTLATGAAPAVHGIPSNRFMVDGEKTYCGDLGLLWIESVGDVFSEAGGQVVGLSLKDRAAMFLAGRTPTLAAWMDQQGVLVERPAAGADPVPVVPPLVPPETVGSWLATSWEPLDPTKLGDHPAESSHEHDHDMGKGFPKIPASEAMPDQPGTALKYTPAGGTYLTTAALNAIDRHGLGADATPDLLTVSYSHFDGIGHAHTPASQESVDSLLRLDQDIGALMDGLDAKVGEGRWSLVLTGDHGAPEGVPTYVDLEAVPETFSAALTAAGLPGTVRGDGHGFWLDPGMDAPTRARAVEVVRAAAVGISGLEAVIAPGAVTPETPFADAYRDGYVAGRSADIELLLDADHIALYPPYGERGTDHGCPRAYDREVPLLAVGAGVASGTGRVDTRTVAPSLAALAGLRPPAGATATTGPYVQPR